MKSLCQKSKQNEIIQKLNTMCITPFSHKKIKNSHVLDCVHELYINDRFSDCDDPEYLRYLGFYKKYRNNYKEAEKFYKKSIDGGDLISIELLAILCFELKRFDESEKLFKLAIEKGSKDSNYYLGYYYQRMKNYQLAEKYYLEAIKCGHTDAASYLGIIYKKTKKFDSAISMFKLAIDGGCIKSNHDLGQLYDNELKDYQLAAKHYKIALRGGFFNSAYNLAVMFDELGMHYSAEKYYLLIIEKMRDLDAIHDLAYLYYYIGKLELSTKYYLMAIEKGDYSCAYGLSKVFKKLDNETLSRKYLIMAAKNYQKNAVDKINRIISDHFDISESIEVVNILNDNNYDILNETICYIVNISS